MCQSVIKVLTSLKTCVTLPLHTILNIHAWYMRDIIRNSYVTNAFFIRRYARMSIGSSVSTYVSSRDFCFELDLLKTFVAEAYALPNGLYSEHVLIKKWMYGDKQCAKNHKIPVIVGDIYFYVHFLKILLGAFGIYEY